MTKRFGFGFEERETSFTPSAQHARALFLELLSQLRPKVIPSLFGSAHRPFVNFLNESKGEIRSIIKDIHPLADADAISSAVGEVNPYRDIAVRLSLSSALRPFLYGWSALRSRGGAGALCDALLSWAGGLNLNDEWFLGHAVTVLREQHLASLNTDEAWQQATDELKLDAVCMQGVTYEDFRERGLDKFSFKYKRVEITVDGPIFQPVPDFKREAERAFKAVGGHRTGGASEAFKEALSLYLSQVDGIVAELRLKNPPRNWAAENQFRWLIEYQVPRVKNYRQIARKVGKDESSIREGVRAAANLIGLTLRSSEPDKHPGRPKGSKNKLTSSVGRVRFKEKKGNAGK